MELVEALKQIQDLEEKVRQYQQVLYVNAKDRIKLEDKVESLRKELRACWESRQTQDA